MKVEDLIDYIFEKNEKRNAVLTLRHWLENSRYHSFINKYKDKIRSKFRNARKSQDIEDVKDVLFEIEIPYFFLLDDKYNVEYEKKYGIGKTRSPDFTVCRDESLEFNVEVKRIRVSKLSTRCHKAINRIIESIQEVPSLLSFSIKIVEEPSECCVTFIENSSESIINQILNWMKHNETTIPYDSPVQFTPDGFHEEISVEFLKPSRKSDFSKTLYFGGCFKIPYTNKEFQKFRDKIFETMGQCISGMINILIITTNSDTHEPEDIYESIKSIYDLIEKRDDNVFQEKGFGGTDEFVKIFQNLTGIVILTSWINTNNNKNLIWCNKYANANHKIPLELQEFLEQMG